MILAGGAARRLSGLDKPALEVGGRTLLARAVGAVAGADPVVVVGPRRDLPADVRWTREDPPGEGPLAGLAAGLAALAEADAEAQPDTHVAVLAADLTGIEYDTVTRLRAALDAGSAAGALLVDESGTPQWLIGVWRLGRLKAALPADPAGRSLRSVLRDLIPVEVPALPGEAADVDTPEDLARHQ